MNHFKVYTRAFQTNGKITLKKWLYVYGPNPFAPPKPVKRLPEDAPAVRRLPVRY